MLSKRCFCSVLVLILGTLSQLMMGVESASIQIDRAEVERVRAAILGRTIIVDWHGTWDYVTIQEALNASVAGDTIIVLPSIGSPGGAYVENIIFPARAVTLRSINPVDPTIVAATVIDGNASGSVVKFAEGTPPEAALEGFTITNGSASQGGGLYLRSSSPTIANNTIAGNIALFAGGGLYLRSSSFPRIANNTIAGNSALDGYGGGLYVTHNSFPTITNNTITGNSAGEGGGGGLYEGGGGGLYLDSSSATIANNTITGNTAQFDGGGLSLNYSSPTITNNTITDNSALDGYGGGLYLLESTATITNNTISGNSADYGSGLYLDSSSATIANNTIIGNSSSLGPGGGLFLSGGAPTIANNTITGNSAGRGGGLLLDASSPTITNNTITDNGAYYYGGGLEMYNSSPTIANNTITGNSAGYDGGGLFLDDSSPTIANTIVAFNSSGIYRTGSGMPTLGHNCVYGNTAYNYSGIADPTGTDGNISADPRFGNPQYGNVHIQPDSPCVDAGNNAFAYGDHDTDGQQRVQPEGGQVDIGADESDGTVWPAGPYVIVRVSPEGDDAHDGSSWPLAKRTVQAGIDAAAALSGDVWVQAGKYSERITLRRYAYVYGGFSGSETGRDERDWSANVTTLDGEHQGSVVTAQASYRVIAIDGFTITNGSASDGGGLYLNGSSPTIANNTITGNSAEHFGGGCTCSTRLRRSQTTRLRTTPHSTATAAGFGCGTPPRRSQTIQSRATAPTTTAAGCTWPTPPQRLRTTRLRATALTMAAGCTWASPPR